MDKFLANTLGLIPARGGSKRLPGKNIKILAGKPMIAYTIEAALASGLQTVVVSTDDDEIASVSRQWGASVPFLRPSSLATDTASSVDVAVHYLGAVEPDYEFLILLQPTSPLRTAEDIRKSLQLFSETGADALVSVSETRLAPNRVLTIEGGFLRLPPSVDNASDDRHHYILNGAIYIIRKSILLEKRTFVPELTVPYIMPESCSVDVDTIADFRLAGLILQNELP